MPKQADKSPSTLEKEQKSTLHLYAHPGEETARLGAGGGGLCQQPVLLPVIFLRHSLPNRSGTTEESSDLCPLLVWPQSTTARGRMSQEREALTLSLWPVVSVPLALRTPVPFRAWGPQSRQPSPIPMPSGSEDMASCMLPTALPAGVSAPLLGESLKLQSPGDLVELGSFRLWPLAPYPGHVPASTTGEGLLHPLCAPTPTVLSGRLLSQVAPDSLCGD